MSVSENVTGTLRAQEHGHQPLVQTELSRINHKDPQLVCYGLNKDPVTYVTSGVQFDGKGLEEKAHTLRARDYKEPQMVCYGLDSYNQTAHMETAETLKTNGGGDNSPKVCYGLDRASFNQGQNARFDFAVEEELSPTIVAKGPGGVMANEASKG